MLYAGLILVNDLDKGPAQIHHEDFTVILERGEENSVRLAISPNSPCELPRIFFGQFELTPTQLDFSVLTGKMTVSDELPFLGKYMILYKGECFEFEVDRATKQTPNRKKLQSIAIIRSCLSASHTLVDLAS